FPKAQDEALMFVLNCTPVPRDGYRLGVPWSGEWKLMLNSDDTSYGGSAYQTAAAVAADEHPWGGFPYSVSFNLPPFSCLVFRGQPS
ncbi:alpha amylase C-terminal domain-containing protein, partial [bacterium]|nr:alpha amylase C-terminal domain-containing protein [bacterium]